MPKASPFLASSNAGEFSPRMDARVDFDKYGAAISRGLNLVCLPQGGLTVRPGTRFIDDIGAHVGALFPFNPVADRAYMIHLWANTLTIYRNQGQLAAPTISAAVTNGGFNTDISGWANLSTGAATIAWAGSTMALNGATNGYAQASQSIAITETTLLHVFRFEVLGSYGAKVTVRIGTTLGGAELFNAVGLGVGWHTIGVVPGVATIHFSMRNEQIDQANFNSVELLSNVPIALTTPYSNELAVTGIEAIRTAQQSDVMYLFHDNFPVYKLERRGDTSWSLVKAFIQDGPWLEINPETDLAATNLIVNPRFDTGFSPGWVPTQVGTGYWRFEADKRIVQLLFSGTAAGSSVGFTQTVAITSLNVPHVLHYQVWGDQTLTTAVSQVASYGVDLYTSADVAGWYSVQFTPTASPIHISWSTVANNALIQSGVTAAFLYATNARLLKPSATTGPITVTALGDFAPFTVADIGRQIRFEYPGAEPGWGIITGFTNAQTVSFQVYRTLVRTAPLETWRMGAWSNGNGWPHTGVFYQQRLIAARNAARPQTVWGSQTADFDNMRPDSWVAGASAVEDNDALNFTIAADRVAPIQWMAGTRRLVAGTGAGQWAIVSSQNKAVITPTDFNADPQTSVASLDIQPAQIDTVVLFAQRAKRTLYELGYSGEADSFRATDVTILSDHITRGNIRQIAYQAEPFSNVWVRLETGKLACLTYKRGQNVIGWTPVEIAGTNIFVRSIAVIPGAVASGGQAYSSLNRDEVWMIVSRTINGGTKNYIEVMEGYFDGPNRAVYLDKEQWRGDMRTAQRDMFYLDCGLTYNGAFTNAIFGLGHLEGERVVVIADGSTREPQTVIGGQIPLEPIGGSVVHVGLAYPWTYRTVKLPFGSATGQGVGQIKAISGLVMVLRDSGALQYAIDLTGEGESEPSLQFFDVPLRTTSDPMGQAVPLFSGEIEHFPGGGYATDPRVIMRGLSDGMPFTLLGISPKIAETEL